jgi:transcriptional regulator with XRE-family HTH domain
MADAFHADDQLSATERQATEGQVTAAIGAQIRRARARVGMSTRELARRASLSQPFLSNIENGRSSPSVMTLYKLAQALGISASELLPSSTASSIVVVRAGEGMVSSLNEERNAALSTLLVGGSGRLIEARQYAIEAGQAVEGWFEHDGEDFVHVTSGLVRVEFGIGHSEELRAGDSLWHEGMVPHRWRVDDAVGVNLLVITARSAIKGSE